jgi:predicted GNAT family N-acyltransferase
MDVRFAEINSPEYFSLCDLRYRVFFQARSFPRDLIFDSDEQSSWHAVVTLENSTDAIACGRLTLLSAEECKISQMAVDPLWQGKGLGSAIMAALLAKAIDLGAKSAVVDARSSAIGTNWRTAHF